MELSWHPYRYYPYERELSLMEVQALLDSPMISEIKNGIRIKGNFDLKAVERLVYFSEAHNGNSDKAITTLQARLERSKGNDGGNRQSTRYSVHGLHEYKGKFNPQISRAILNILRVPIGSRVLDPFCGSGTTLVECTHIGMNATGLDINPLAVFIANAKLSAINISADRLSEEGRRVVHLSKSSKPCNNECDAHLSYLSRWFDPHILGQIECLRATINRGGFESAVVLLSIASNLLREYSLQDPHDLRIRRRKSPLPDISFFEAFEQAVGVFSSKLGETQRILGHQPLQSKAILADSSSMRLGANEIGRKKFDCALTSPPYATALPYIDTQRLSLVWLRLISPSDILTLEASLVGSREIRGKNKKELLCSMVENHQSLPEKQIEYCHMLQSALSSEDGFRRQAVPILLYRYFVDMAKVFRSVRSCMKKNAPFALIIGRNHTVLGGQRFEIDTPSHLIEIASSCGWTHEETITLQTYQRYGYHMNNAVNSEALIILRSA